MADNYNEKANQQRESIQLEKEYQDALKMSSSISNQITSALNSQVDFRSQLGKKVKEHYKALSSNIKQLETSEDIAKKILEIEGQNLKISKSYRGVNIAIGRQMLLANNLAVESLKIEQSRVGVIEEIAKKTEQFTSALNDGIDNALGSLKDIPVIGGMLSSIANGPAKRLKGAFSEAGKAFVTDFASNLRGGMGLMQSLSAAGGSAGKILIAAFTGPQAILIAMVAVIGAGIFAFYKISAAAKQFREETGLLNSQTKGLEEQFSRVAASTAAIGGSVDDVAKAAAVFSNQFEGLEQASDGVLTSMVALNKNFGVGIEEGARLNKLFTSMGNMSANTAQNLINTTVQSAKLAGVAPDKVIKDMAESAEDAYNFFKGNPAELAKAAVAAAKLGSSLKEAVSVSKGLLDFESSITAELNASSMLGKNISFNQARSLAAQGKAVDAQKAVVAEVEKLGDLSKLDMFSLEALATASGMSIESLQRQISIKQKFGQMDEEQLAAANKLLDAGKDISDISDEELAKSAEQIKSQRELQSVFDDMGNELSAVGTEILMAFMPLGKIVLGVLIPAFKVLGSVIKSAFVPLTFAISTIQNIYDLISALTTDGFSGMLAKIKELGPLMTGIALTVGVIATSFLVSIIPSVMAFAATLITTIIPGLFSAAGAAITWAIGMAATALGAITTASALTLGVGAIAIAAGVAYSMGAFDSQMSSVESTVPSINDGVVQDGKIVSTHPDDFLIATKTPGALADSISSGGGSVVSGLSDSLSGGNVNISMDGVISELQSLKAVFMASRDVYMDGTKITAGISRKVEKIGSNSYAV